MLLAIQLLQDGQPVSWEHQMCMIDFIYAFYILDLLHELILVL